MLGKGVSRGVTEFQGPRDQGCCLDEQPERGVGISEGRKGQAEELCSMNILDLN